PTVLRCALVLAALMAPQAVQAAAWQAIAGAQSRDMGRQALAFLPNELWVHAGDSITWTFATPEIHTVTFLRANQIRPSFPEGCPGTTPGDSSEPGTACVNSGVLVSPQTYTVNFLATGNFKLVCLVHPNMTGAVHVLDPSETLPHDQAFYDRLAHRERTQLLSDGSRLRDLGRATARR